jgi:hypothetical protein
MYGDTNVPEFLGLEGYEDHDVNMLFFWNQDGKLIATIIEVPCPAQEVENQTTVNADFWHPVRVALRQRFGADLCVLGMVGAAGDQSPHLMYRKAAEERMRKLRNLSRMDRASRLFLSGAFWFFCCTACGASSAGIVAWWSRRCLGAMGSTS